MTVITRADILRFTPHADARIADAFVTYGDAAFARWQITTALRLQMFMAHGAVESGWLTSVFENMHYSGPRLWAVFGAKHFASLADATAVASQGEKAVANRVYGGRMGNIGPDDGFLCRGQGLMQTTGLTNFTALARHMGQTVEETRARLTSDEGMIDCAAATFHMLGCHPFADAGDVTGCTKRINGGLNGLNDRETAYAKAKAVWPTMRPLAAPALAAVVPTPVVVPQPTRPLVPVVVAGPHSGVVQPSVSPPLKQTWGQWFAQTFFRRTA